MSDEPTKIAGRRTRKCFFALNPNTFSSSAYVTGRASRANPVTVTLCVVQQFVHLCAAVDAFLEFFHLCNLNLMLGLYIPRCKNDSSSATVPGSYSN